MMVRQNLMEIASVNCVYCVFPGDSNIATENVGGSVCARNTRKVTRVVHCTICHLKPHSHSSKSD